MYSLINTYYPKLSDIQEAIEANFNRISTGISLPTILIQNQDFTATIILFNKDLKMKIINV